MLEEHFLFFFLENTFRPNSARPSRSKKIPLFKSDLRLLVERPYLVGILSISVSNHLYWSSMD